MIGSRKKTISVSHIGKIADKKTSYNEGHLYLLSFSSMLFNSIILPNPSIIKRNEKKLIIKNCTFIYNFDKMTKAKKIN
jgi:hypothetical protein